MAIEVKMSFLEMLRRRLAPEVTAEAMPRIIAGASGILLYRGRIQRKARAMRNAGNRSYI